MDHHYTVQLVFVFIAPPRRRVRCKTLLLIRITVHLCIARICNGLEYRFLTIYRSFRNPELKSQHTTETICMYVFWSELLSSAAEAIKQAHCRRSLNPYTLYVIFLFILQSRYVAVSSTIMCRESPYYRNYYRPNYLKWSE